MHSSFKSAEYLLLKQYNYQEDNRVNQKPTEKKVEKMFIAKQSSVLYLYCYENTGYEKSDENKKTKIIILSN